MSVERKTGWFHDLFFPGYLWADTEGKWVVPGMTYHDGMSSYNFDNTWLVAAFEELQRQEAAIGRWALGGTKLPFGDELQGRFPLVGRFLNEQVQAAIILLPTKIDGLSDLEERLTIENLQKWSAELKPREVNVHLPKFKTTSEFNLGGVLASMGMSLAFSSKADFSRMSTQEPLLISAVIHKAFVDVNEEGTEADCGYGDGD